VIGVTGANGYVGGRILDHLRGAGLEAVALVRRPREAGEQARPYALGDPLEDGALEGIETVVHAAYDASQRGEQIRAVNVLGSMPLLDALAAKGGRVVLISSLSAFEGARSLYGQAKLELESLTVERGGVALRPGLVFGREAAGLFGAMAAALTDHAIVPLPGGGSQRQFLTHDEHLAELIAAIVTRRFTPARTAFAAHEAPTTLRGIAEQIAAAGGHSLRVIPLPALPVALGMRAAESIGVPLPFRADSMVSLMHPIPLDQVAALERTPVEFPALEPSLWAG
jgi:nucleoside-diphosphate-sugar epimerase